MASLKPIEQLSFEQRAELAAWLHGRKGDEWHPPLLSYDGVAGEQVTENPEKEKTPPMPLGGMGDMDY
jgi:hypothetical protein